jgi:hypothetical protein
MNILCPAPGHGANLALSGLRYAAPGTHPVILLILTPPGGDR